MAIIIEANYSKKIGLPAYSSHAYSVTIRTEVSDLGQVERESAQLYALLQESVDRNIQEVGLELKPAHDGAVVAELVDGESTLKRYFVRRGSPQTSVRAYVGEVQMTGIGAPG